MPIRNHNNSGKRSKKQQKESLIDHFRGTEQPPVTSMINLFNYKALTDDPDHLLVAKDKNDGYIDLLQIQGHGLGSLTYDQQSLVLQDYHRFLQVFLADHKYIITPFPIDASDQKSFWGRRYIKVSNQIRHENNPIKQKQLQTQLRYIQTKQKLNLWVESNLRSEEFFMVLFGKTKQQVRERRETAINSGGVALIMSPLTLEKKKEILFRINNLNTEVK